MSDCSKNPVLRTHHLPCLRTIHLLAELHVKISAKQKNSLPALRGQQVSASVGKLFAHFAEDLEKLTEAGMVKMLLLVKLMARLHPKRWNGSVTLKVRRVMKSSDIGWQCLFLITDVFWNQGRWLQCIDVLYAWIHWMSTFQVSWQHKILETLRLRPHRWNKFYPDNLLEPRDGFGVLSKKIWSYLLIGDYRMVTVTTY